jgi:outer membrane receptor protein involved in Fe transport
VLDANTELAATAYVRSGKQKRLGGDVEWGGDWDTTPPTPGDTEGVLNRTNTSQTSYGVSVNMTKLLDAHQITTGASLDLSTSKYGANTQEECHIDESRGVTTDCDLNAVDTAAVKGGATSFGVFISDTVKLSDQTFLSVAGRFNHTSIKNTITDYTDANDDWQEGVDLTEEKSTYTSWNPSLGISHKFGDNLTAFGNWSQSNRAPTVIELGCADKDNPCQLPTGLQADPPLDQVIATTLEAGIRWTNSSGYKLAMSIYQTENKNDILFLPVSTQAGMRGFFDNFAKTRYQGLDINATKSWSAVRLNTAYSYVKATYEAEAEILAGDRVMAITPGMRLPGLPLHTLKLNLDWQVMNQLNIGAGIQYSSSLKTQGNEDGKVGDDDDAVADASIKGHTLLNLKANYQLQKGLSLFGKINNVLDTRYETYGMIGDNNFNLDGSKIDPAGFNTVAKFVAPGAPRSYMVGLRYQF